MKIKHDFQSLESLYRSQEYEYFISDKLGNQLFMTDPERAERLDVYAADGCNGSTHAEIIGDWREFLESLKSFDPEFDDEEGEYDITMEQYRKIAAEIDDCEKWHIENKSIDTIIN